jgi:hypothetical protein
MKSYLREKVRQQLCVHRCVVCSRPMSMADYIISPICLECAKRAHQRAAGRNVR